MNWTFGVGYDDRDEPEKKTQRDYARDNDWIIGPRAEYADAEAARQDATTPHEAPQCVADRAVERRVLAGKLMQARWMMHEVERLLNVC